MRSVLAWHALAAGRAPLLVRPGEVALNYDAISRQAAALAGSLHAFGITSRDRVALVLPEGVDTAIATLAVSSAAACAPLNPAYDEGLLRPLLAALKPAAIVVPAGADGAAHATARALAIRIIRLADGAQSFIESDDVRADHDSAELDLPDPDEIAFLLFTSGTTARPKLVPLTHRNIAAAAQSMIDVLQLTPFDRSLGVMPLYHIHGLSTLFASILSGGSYVPASPFSPQSFYDALRESKPTWYSASPTIHRVALDHIALYGGDVRKSNFRFIRSASAPMPPTLIEQMERAFGVPFIEAYGMTEASPQIASNRLDRKHKRRSVGRAAGPEVAVLADDGQILSNDAEGEVLIRGENVMSCYLDDLAANRDAFVDGWFRTGDLGRIDADGHLFITGRSKEIINRGGEKISPRKIDDVLSRHAAVAEVVTFAVPHPVLGENVAAAIVLPKAISADAAERNTLATELIAFAGAHLAAFEVPHQLLFVDKIPLGPSGKVVRNRLANDLGLSNGEKHSTGPRVPPRTASERCVAEVFEKVLKAPAPCVHDNFFALGGHSLAATEVVFRLRDIFKIALPPEALFATPTVAQLAATLDARMGQTEGTNAVDAPLIVKLKDGDSRPPLICLPPIFGSPLTYVPLSKLLRERQSVYALRFDDGAPRTNITDFARYFLDRVREISPRGPYRLCGYSFGGIVAHEMARLLTEAGERVEFLGLLDSFVPQAKRRLAWPGRLMRKLGALGQKTPREAVRELIRPLRKRQTSSATPSSGTPRLDAARPDQHPDVTSARQRMLKAAVLQPFGQSVTLFRAQARWAHDLYFATESMNGFERLGDVDVRHIPGDHLSMMQPPNLELLARVFDQELGRLARRQMSFAIARAIAPRAVKSMSLLAVR